MFSNVRSVLSQCNTGLRLLHLLYDIEVMWRKAIKHAFSMFYTLIKHGFLTNQRARSIQCILYIYFLITTHLKQCSTLREVVDILDKSVPDSSSYSSFIATGMFRVVKELQMTYGQRIINGCYGAYKCVT